MESAMTPVRDRARGALIGLATGDAVGTTVEFKPRGSFPPVTTMTGGGPFGLEPGQFTDDTSMALCLAESLSASGRFDVRDQLTRYVRWWRHGHLSSNGRCFDIGGATRSALARFEATGELVNDDRQAAGNGSLMRLAPAALFARGDQALAAELAARSSVATHGAPQATDSCRLFAVMLTSAVAGASKQELLDPELWAFGDLHPEVDEIARGSYLRREPPEIQGSGYVVRCLEAALWAFARTDSFAEGCLLAVNLGDDADTTAAVYGQIAGAFYGESGIPAAWREKLALWETLDALAESMARWHPEMTEPAKLPDLHAYWIEPGVLIAGEYPGAQTEAEAERKLASLLDVGVRRFVDLTEEGELEPYEALLQQLAWARGVSVEYARHPIRDVGVPRDEATMRGILDELAAAERDGVPAYVHCWGGIGRTGTVVGCHQVERGYSAARALERIEELRRDSSKASRRSPETATQSDFVRNWAEAWPKAVIDPDAPPR
jgi:ADP-ribosyl-[dinitrogen reductase] hydrolase